jgi:hypothetical protein
MHQFQPQCPEELWMMVREVSLSRCEQLFLGVASELRPALAVSNPSVAVRAGGHLIPMVATVLRLSLRPAENLFSFGWDPGFHGRQHSEPALSIRFQIVAGSRGR